MVNKCGRKRGQARRANGRKTLGHGERLEARELLASQGLDLTPIAVTGIGNVNVFVPDNGVAYLNSVAVASDGSRVEVGSLSLGGNPTGEYIVGRVTADGNNDVSFGNHGAVVTPFGGGGQGAEDVALQADGKILVIGSSGLVRYNTDGSLDTSFGTGGIVPTAGTSWVAVQADGRIVTAGPELRRFNADGTPDLSFGTSGVIEGSNVSQFALQPDGKIVAVNGNVVWRYNPDGSVDWSFAGGRTVAPATSAASEGRDTIALAPDGKIVWVGSLPYGGGTAIEAVRFNTDGSLDTSFATGGIAIIHDGANTDPFAALVEADGTILIAGRSGTVGPNAGPTQFAGSVFTARLNNDGSLDGAWGIGGVSRINLAISSEAHALAEEPDGKIVLAGGHGGGPAAPNQITFTTFTLSGDFNESFVESLYPVLLDRDGDAAGVAYFTDALDRRLLTRLQVVQAFQNSIEYREMVVGQIYQQLLIRKPDPGGLAFWTSFLAAGGTRQQLEIAIAGSPEFFAVTDNRNDRFVMALFNDLLFHPPSAASEAEFEQALAAGASHASVAADIILSPEQEQLLVNGFYGKFLSRPADPSGFNAYVTEILHGATLEQVTESMITSDEYFAGLA